MNIRIVELTYHRNGVAGRGFYSIRFQWTDDENVSRNMIASVFADENREPNGLVSVYDIEQLAVGNIAFANGNSWRGDEFEPELLEAIAAEDEQSSIDNAVESILRA